MKDRERDEEIADAVEDSPLSLEIQHSFGSGQLRGKSSSESDIDSFACLSRRS